MKPAYLEFVEIEDYAQHVKQFYGDTTAPAGVAREVTDLGRTPITNLEFTSTSGRPGKFGVYGVTFHAVATANLGDHIAVIDFVLLSTSSLNLDHASAEERDIRKKQLHERFDQVKEQLTQAGLTVERGKWTLQSPDYLKH